MTLQEAMEIGEVMWWAAASYAFQEDRSISFRPISIHFLNPEGKEHVVTLYLPVKEVGVSEYRCNKYGCGGEMRPTRRLDDFPYSHERYRMRYYRCVECGNETPWLAYPDPSNTTFGRVHALQGGGHSGGSMLSDPRFYPPKPPSRRRRA